MGNGYDTFVFHAGDGADRIVRSGGDNSQPFHFLEFGLMWARSSITGIGEDLVFSYGDADSVRVEGQFFADPVNAEVNNGHSLWSSNILLERRCHSVSLH